MTGASFIEGSGWVEMLGVDAQIEDILDTKGGKGRSFGGVWILV